MYTFLEDTSRAKDSSSEEIDSSEHEQEEDRKGKQALNRYTGKILKTGKSLNSGGSKGVNLNQSDSQEESSDLDESDEDSQESEEQARNDNNARQQIKIFNNHIKPIQTHQSLRQTNFDKSVSPEYQANNANHEKVNQQVNIDDVEFSESSEESEESDDDDEKVFNIKNQMEVLETLWKIKQKDPSIFDQERKFYSEEEEEEAMRKEGVNQELESKPILLSDLQAEMIMQGGEKALEQAEEEYEKNRPKAYSLMYDDQQRENLKLFQQAMQCQESEESSDLEDQKDMFGFLEKKPDQVIPQQSNSNLKEEKQQEVKKQQLAKQVFDEQDEKERFLQDYLLNERWKGIDDEEEDEGGHDLSKQSNDIQFQQKSDLDDAVDLSEDEEFLQEADKFEAKYNFRYEEEGADRLVSFPREQSGSVRETKSRKKRQREARAQREIARLEENERELKRQKNVKTKEIREMVEQIQKEAGGHVDVGKLTDALLGGGDLSEFYDNLDAAFGDEYYAAEDAEYSDVDDAEQNDDQQEDVNHDEAGDGPGQQNEQWNGNDYKQGGEEGYDDDDGYDEFQDKSKLSKEEVKQKLSQKVQEYHDLDYEEERGGVKWKFKYTEVPKEHYGLTPEDILKLSDKELNQVVGIAHFAPYKNSKIRPNYKKLQELTNRDNVRSASYAWESGLGKTNKFGNNQKKQQFDRQNKKTSRNKKRNSTQQNNSTQQINDKMVDEKEDDSKIDPIKQRMSSFFKPVLSIKKNQSKYQSSKQKNKEKRKREASQQQQNQKQENQVQGLSKAQKRNMRRTQQKKSKAQAQ